MKIRYYSHVGLHSGYGKAALELALALARTPGLELELVQIPVKGTPRMGLGLDPKVDPRVGELVPLLRATGTAGAMDPPAASAQPDVVIVHTLPRDCLDVATRDGCFAIQDVIVVAYTTWDGIRAPRLVVERLRPFHQVWVPSFTSKTPLRDPDFPSDAQRVEIVPHAYDPAVRRPARRTQDGGRYRFYWVGAWTPRKNPVGLIRAYSHAFSCSDDVELVLRSAPDPVEFVTALASSGLEQQELPLVTLHREPMAEDDLLQLHADCDCYVSASCGEAWDLAAFDAFLARRYAIVSDGSGAAAYLGKTDAGFVRTVPEPAQMGVVVEPVIRHGGAVGYRTIVTGQTGMTCRDLWRPPVLVELGQAMRAAYADRRRDLEVACDPQDLFSHHAVAARAVDLLVTLLAQRKDYSTP